MHLCVFCKKHYVLLFNPNTICIVCSFKFKPANTNAMHVLFEIIFFTIFDYFLFACQLIRFICERINNLLHIDYCQKCRKYSVNKESSYYCMCCDTKYCIYCAKFNRTSVDWPWRRYIISACDDCVIKYPRCPICETTMYKKECKYMNCTENTYFALLPMDIIKLINKFYN